MPWRVLVFARWRRTTHYKEFIYTVTALLWQKQPKPNLILSNPSLTGDFTFFTCLCLDNKSRLLGFLCPQTRFACMATVAPPATTFWQCPAKQPKSYPTPCSFQLSLSPRLVEYLSAAFENCRSWIYSRVHTNACSGPWNGNQAFEPLDNIVYCCWRPQKQNKLCSPLRLIAYIWDQLSLKNALRL